MKKAEIVAALTRLNQNYGRGNLVSVDVERGVFVVQPFKLLPETRKFRVKGRTAFAPGHQLTVPSGQKEKKDGTVSKGAI
jgi:hypothetical protein